jgi:hypothetical protein
MKAPGTLPEKLAMSGRLRQIAASRLLVRSVSMSSNRGQLTAQQRTQLKGMLDRMTATALPEQLGSSPQINARRITLAYGGKQSVLSMPPGGGDLGALHAAAGDIRRASCWT